MKHKSLYFIYLAGFFLVLSLPILNLQPWLFPPDWIKAVLFRVILSILAGLLMFQWLYQPSKIIIPPLKKNIIFWLLGALFIVFSLATLFSVDPRFSLFGSPTRGGGFVNIAAYMVFAVLAFLMIKKSYWQKLWIFEIFIGALVALVAICQFYGLLGNIFIHFPNSPPSTLGNSTFLAIYLLLLFFRVLFFAIKKPFRLTDGADNAVKIGCFFIMILFGWVILITGSRAAYLGLLVGFTYFILFYPRKLFIFKITAGFLLVVVFLGIYLANINPVPPALIAQNKVLNNVYHRLSLQTFANDARFYSWRIAAKALAEKPILGWGPENFSVGFDKHYDPSLPHIGSIVSNWWDRAHNIFFDVGVQAGILGIIAYFGLLAGLFWQLQKLQHLPISTPVVKQETALDAHLLQTALIAYLASNLFSFDSFATYLVFFMMAGYSMHLTQLHAPSYRSPASAASVNNKGAAVFLRSWKHPIAICLGAALVFFIWQYNLWPFKVNADANKADLLVADNQCPRAFELMEKIMGRRSILDARVRMQYVEAMNICVSLHPQNNLAYAKRGVEVMKEAVAVQPLFARLWIFLGGFTNVVASVEKDPIQKGALLTEANFYLQKASELAPDHQELIMEQIKVDMVSGDHQAMLKNAQKCADLYPDVGACYFFRALSKLYLGNISAANQDLEIAKANNFDAGTTQALNQLVTVYADIKQYQKLSEAYLGLIGRNLLIADYHASLAFTYREMGQHQKARQEALIFLKMMPEAKDEVNEFLKTLP